MKRAHIIPPAAPATTASPAPEYISYQKAKKILSERIGATPEEISLWAWLKKCHGGFDPYSSCKPASYGNAAEPQRLNPPTHDQVSAGDSMSLWLASAYFRKTDIEEFDPVRAGRFISWPDLLKKWQAHGLTENETLIKVRGLIDNDAIDEPMAPIFGLTQISWSGLAPIDWALFKLEQIEAIEKQDFPADNAEIGDSLENTDGDTVQSTQGEIANIKIGNNLRAVYAAWVAAKAKRLVTFEDTRATLANKIKDLALTNGYYSESENHLSLDSFIAMIPAGTTGIRGKNGRKKQQKQIGMPI